MAHLRVIVVILRFHQDPLLAATTLLNLLGLQRLFVGLIPSFLVVHVLRILFDSQHADRVTLGVAHAKKHIALARTCNEHSLRLKCKFHVSTHHVFGHAGNAGNECADVAASLGLRGFISENTLPRFS